MPETPSPGTLSRSRLIRVASELGGVVGSAPADHFALRLGRMIDLSHSINLSMAHGRPRTIEPEPARERCEAVREELLSAKEALVRSIVRGFETDQGPRRLRFPVALPGSDDGASSFEACHKCYSAHQADMEFKLKTLQLSVRQQVSCCSAELAQLCELDTALGDAIAAHARKAFTGAPALLRGHYDACARQLSLALDEATAEESAEHNEWQHFRVRARELLLAELEARLLPIQGLMEALDELIEKQGL